MQQHHAVVYRPLFLRALKTAWQHRELWVIAILAGFAGTGAVLNDALREAKFAFALPNGGTDGLWYFASAVQNVVRGAVTGSVAHLWATLGVLGSTLLLLLIAVILAQHILISSLDRATKNKKRLPLRQLFSSLNHLHFWRIFSIDALFKVVTLDILFTTAVVLSRLETGAPFFDALLGITIAALGLALCFALNIVAMLMLVAVVRDDATLGEAWLRTHERLQGHAVVAFEMSAILFAINLALSAVYVIGLGLVVLPISLLSQTALTQGHPEQLITIAILGALVAMALTALVSGFITTFTYASWSELTHVLDKTAILPRLHAYTRRLRSHFKTR